MHLRYDDGKLKRGGSRRAERLLWFACEKYFSGKRSVKKSNQTKRKSCKESVRKFNRLFSGHYYLTVVFFESDQRQNDKNEGDDA